MLKGCRFVRNIWAVTLRNFSGEASTTVGGVVFTKDEVKNFIERCVTSVGAKKHHANALADNLVSADYRGHFSHGLNRTEIYVQDLERGLALSNREPELVRETAATAFVDGCNLLGPVVGNYSMKIALRKAKEAGVGWVVANNSNHFGIAGYYSMQASDIGLIGMSFTNTSPLVVPTRSKEKLLGTNPISLAAPGKNKDAFVLDMATSAVALGKIEVASVKRLTIPEGWGADKKGKVTTNPVDVLQGGGQLPLGGAETTSGYKGYGLGMMVEIFCGIMANAKYGPNIREWKESTRPAELGQCFVAIDPEVFSPGFAERMQDLMDICRNSQKSENDKEVLVAGDPERLHMQKCDREGGIRYHPNQIEKAKRLASQLGITPMQPLDI